MTGFEAAVLFSLAAVLALCDIAGSLRRIYGRAGAIKAQLEACPQSLEMRYRITETVTAWNDGTVVEFPVRRSLPRPAHGLRAAA